MTKYEELLEDLGNQKERQRKYQDEAFAFAFELAAGYSKYLGLPSEELMSFLPSVGEYDTRSNYTIPGAVRMNSEDAWTFTMIFRLRNEGISTRFTFWKEGELWLIAFNDSETFEIDAMKLNFNEVYDDLFRRAKLLLEK